MMMPMTTPDPHTTTKLDTGASGQLALWCNSDSHAGVAGTSISYIGVYGRSFAAAKPAILGASVGAGTGVQGYSGPPGTEPAAPAMTGVYGYAAQDSTASGVLGVSTAGHGVYGQATTGSAVRAVVTTGTAVYASTGGLKSGIALRTAGKVKFDNSVGIATVAVGTSSVTVTPGIALTSTSAVVATLQGSAGGTTSVCRVSVNATTDKFTIYLSAKSTVAVKVAWHVFG